MKNKHALSLIGAGDTTYFQPLEFNPLKPHCSVFDWLLLESRVSQFNDLHMVGSASTTMIGVPECEISLKI